MNPTLRRLAVEEDGAAYTLSYVMVIPVYALLICLIIETCLMLTAKLGTVYAGYAAARSASVWSSATTWKKFRRIRGYRQMQVPTCWLTATTPRNR